VLDEGLRADITSRDAGVTDDQLQPKPAYTAILNAFQNAPARTPI